MTDNIGFFGCSLTSLLICAGPIVARAQAPAHATIVHSAFGGQIFGFDIDQTGTEGVLSEAKGLGGNKVLAAVETFDQATGTITKVIAKTETKDNFLTLGVTGRGIGLIEREHVKTIYVSKRTYDEIRPLGANAFNGKWMPPLKADDIVLGLSRNQGGDSAAVLTYHNKGVGNTFVFGSDVAAGTFGPQIALTNPVFGICCGPVVAFDAATNQAVVAASTGAVGGPPPVFALADLTTGKVTEFNGLPGDPPYRAGYINGLAVDSTEGIACTTTELDAKVEFYDLAKQTGFAVVLPGATSQLQSGSDVEFDPLNRLFFVAQSVSSTASKGSSIQVYDTQGNLVESLNGFSFSNASNVVGTHIALNPATRTGYVDGPDAGVTELQRFSY
jgi:hypothetical protein